MKRTCAALLATLVSTTAFAADPAPIAVPAGHALALTLMRAGDLGYECPMTEARLAVSSWQ